jgi:hypothetical protein
MSPTAYEGLDAKDATASAALVMLEKVWAATYVLAMATCVPTARVLLMASISYQLAGW